MIGTRSALALLATTTALASGLMTAPAAQAAAPALALAGSAAPPSATGDATLSFRITVSGSPVDAATAQLTLLGLLAVALGALIMRLTAQTRPGRHRG